MINIPVATINERSPYQVIEIDTNVFLFTNCYGISYNVGFSPDSLFIENSDVYQFYIVNTRHEHFIHDPLVEKTIEVIIETFFEQDSNILLYICDMIDGRQSFRNRLFKRWVEEYPGKDKFSFINKAVKFGDIEYYGSIIIMKSHPEYDIIVDTFNNFVEQILEKLNS